MVGVAPAELLPVDVALGEDLVADAVAPALPRLGREDGDDAQAHRRHADHEHLPAVSAGGEHDVVVVAPDGM